MHKILDGISPMLKERFVSGNIVYAIVFSLLTITIVGCASRGTKSADQVEVIHLTFPKDQLQTSVHNLQQASVHNPQDTGNAIVSTIDPQVPIIKVERKDRLPPDSPVIIALPSDLQSVNEEAKNHTVEKGDTLYSIAKKYNKDFRQLAIVNKLDTNFTIVPGQILSLDTNLVQNYASKTPITDNAKTPQTQKKQKVKRSASSNTKVYSGRQMQKKNGISWIWPVLGKPKVLRAFRNDQGENVKGIDIAGNKGDKVLSTSDGLVVYAGNELNGYGNLIIISHGERHISAYAHNTEILVKEKQKVKQGQVIATIGSTGADRTKLFFQIRHDSKPIDPITYLPKR